MQKAARHLFVIKSELLKMKTDKFEISGEIRVSSLTSRHCRNRYVQSHLAFGLVGPFLFDLVLYFIFYKRAAQLRIPSRCFCQSR